VKDSTDLAAADSSRKANTPGTLLVTGNLPPGIAISVGGIPFSPGVPGEMKAGRYAATASAPGYDTWNKVQDVVAGKTDTIVVDMVKTQVAANNFGNQGAQAPTGPAATENARIRITPLRTVIYLDEKQIGTGTYVGPITIGKHTLRFEAAGCNTESMALDMKKNQPPIIKIIEGCQ
jgi:hypothetical protein